MARKILEIQTIQGTKRFLAQDYVTVCESPNPAEVFCYTPGIARCPGGRLIATCDLSGPATWSTEGVTYACPSSGRRQQGRVFVSDDAGRTWTQVASFPFLHARPFVAGESLYVLGQARDLWAIRSTDWGKTWSAPVRLTEGQAWQQSACNVHHAHGCVYLVMERRTTFDLKTWEVGEFAPVLMRGRVGDDLTCRSNWTFASELSFRKLLANIETDPAIDYFGVPFFAAPYPYGSEPGPGRYCAPMGWLEANVVQFVDPDHVWADPQGCTYHLWLRAHTGGTGYAAIAKVTEERPGSGAMHTALERAPSGKKILFVPCPGGHMRFHVIYDEPSRLYWLLSTQAVDSMTRADRLPSTRYNLPNNQRRRMQLHFSRNMVDWCFAGMVAEGPAENAARHYASMIADGDDLLILSRSGDTRARSAHDGNLITFHRLRDFRGLVY
jgi:hypothetical protein